MLINKKIPYYKVERFFTIFVSYELIIITMTNNELLNLLKDIKSKPVSIKFDITDKYDYIVDIYYDKTDNSIGMSTRGTGGLSSANWYEDIPEEHQRLVDYLHLEDDDCTAELIIK